MEQVWDRQPKETRHSYHGFCHYRDMGSERSIDKAWVEHQKKCRGLEPEQKRAGNLWYTWSSRWDWVQRAALYDHSLDLQVRDARAKEIIAAGVRHEQLGRLLQAKAMGRLMKLDEQGTGLSPTAATQMAKIGVELERLAQNQPTGIEKVLREEEEADDIWDELMEDPEARGAYLQLLEKVSGYVDQAGSPVGPEVGQRQSSRNGHDSEQEVPSS